MYGRVQLSRRSGRKRGLNGPDNPPCRSRCYVDWRGNAFPFYNKISYKATRDYCVLVTLIGSLWPPYSHKNDSYAFPPKCASWKQGKNASKVRFLSALFFHLINHSLELHALRTMIWISSRDRFTYCVLPSRISCRCDGGECECDCKPSLGT